MRIIVLIILAISALGGVTPSKAYNYDPAASRAERMANTPPDTPLQKVLTIGALLLGPFAFIFGGTRVGASREAKRQSLFFALLTGVFCLPFIIGAL